MFKEHSWRGFGVGLALVIGNITVAWAAAGAASYTYDDIGRITSVIYEDGTGQFYNYDDAGNRKASYSGTPAIASFASTSQTTTEPASGATGTVSLTVNLTGSTALSPQFQYKTVDGSAKAGTHYTAASGTLTFTGTTTSQTIKIATLHHNGYDGPLSFSVQLQPISASTAVGAGTVQVTINDADPAPKFSIAAASASEGQPVTFTVTKANATSLTTSVSYATSDGTAISGIDYTTSRAALTFKSGDTSETFSVPTFHRSYYEGTRKFNVALSSPGGGATLGTATASGSIADVDSATTFAINSPAKVVAGSPVVFTVTKSGGTAGLAFSLNYATTPASAVAGTDYSTSGSSGSITFGQTDTTKTITINTMPHLFDGSTKTFTVTLSNATNNAPIKTPSGTGSLLEVPPVPSVTPTQQYVTTTNRNFYLTWTMPSGTPSTFWYQVWAVGGTAPLKSAQSLSYSGGQMGMPGASSDYQVRACTDSSGSTCGAFSAAVTVTVDDSGL